MRLGKLSVNQNGFSMISVVISISIVGFVMVALSQLLSTTMQGQALVNDTLDATNQVQTLKVILSSPKNCEETFVNQNSGVIAPILSQAISIRDLYIVDSTSTPQK